MRVYCQDCKYLKGRSGPQEYMRCDYPSNVMEENSWLSPSDKKSYIYLPLEQNASNDCKWYESDTPEPTPKSL